MIKSYKILSFVLVTIFLISPYSAYEIPETINDGNKQIVMNQENPILSDTEDLLSDVVVSHENDLKQEPHNNEFDFLGDRFQSERENEIISKFQNENTELYYDSIGIDQLSNNDSFISIWDTTLISTGSSSDTQIKLPLTSSGSYDFIIDWGDETTDIISSYNQEEVTHDYGSTGTYTINITGHLEGWRFANAGDRLKIIELVQWGNMSLGNEGSYFYGASNLVLSANDSPDLSSTTNLDYAFKSAINLGSQGNMSNWNISKITSMRGMFSGALFFNQWMGSWDVSNVLDMSEMFRETYFNQKISSWDVSSVTNMSLMFSFSAFNQPLDNWNVSSVKDMFAMFLEARSFNQNLNSWNVSSVINMTGMFAEADSFDQPLISWDVSSVINMSYMFHRADSFNQSLNSWDVSNVTDMSYMFQMAGSFNQSLNSWNVGNVRNMKYMFDRAYSFNQPLSNWNVSSVINMSSIFKGVRIFNQDISSWDVSNVLDMSSMFDGVRAFNSPLNSWDVSSVVDMSKMFNFAESFNQPLNEWDVSKVKTTKFMFYSAEIFNQDISSWNVSSVTDMSYMFLAASSFNSPLNSWNVASVIDMSQMFSFASSFNQPLNSWDVSNVINMGSMFSFAESFNQRLNSWNVASVLFMDGMFRSTLSFDQDISSWDVTNVVDMYFMFNNVKLSTENYDKLLIAWSKLPLQGGVDFNAGESQYSWKAKDARQSIIDTYSWTILDAGQLDTPPIIDSPEDITYTIGDNGTEIIWNVQDDNPDYFKITKNGTSFFIDHQPWSTGSISINVDGLDIGMYNFTIQLFDTGGHSVSDTVFVTVLPDNDEIQEPFQEETPLFGIGPSWMNFGLTTLIAMFTSILIIKRKSHLLGKEI